MPITPIFELAGSSELRSMYADAATGAVYVGLSDGKILAIQSLVDNAYLTGQRSIYAQFQDGFGNLSDAEFANVMYRLNSAVVDIDIDKQIVDIRSVKLPSAAAKQEQLVGVFTSSILWAGDDFGFWDTLNWTESKSDNTDVVVSVRTAATAEGIVSSPWVSYSSTDGSPTQTRSLDGLNPTGAYIQIRVSLQSTVANPVLSAASVSVSYRAKSAVFFFTKKFVLDRASQLSSGLITARVSPVANTEVKFGIVGSNTADWNSYKLVSLNRIFELPESIRTRFKVGIKMITYKDGDFPVVDEFAAIFSGEADNLINQL